MQGDNLSIWSHLLNLAAELFPLLADLSPVQIGIVDIVMLVIIGQIASAHVDDQCHMVEQQELLVLWSGEKYSSCDLIAEI